MALISKTLNPDGFLARDRKGNHSVDGDAFVFIDNDSVRVVSILGYPTDHIASWDDLKISNMFG